MENTKKTVEELQKEIEALKIAKEKSEAQALAQISAMAEEIEAKKDAPRRNFVTIDAIKYEVVEPFILVKDEDGEIANVSAAELIKNETEIRRLIEVKSHAIQLVTK